MYYRDKVSWHYYAADSKEWCDTGSAVFDDRVTRHAGLSSITGNYPKTAQPAFAGTKIVCVGRNYRKHAAELGHDVPERPLWFSKPPSSITGDGQQVFLPQGYGRIDYEGELALLICRRARNVSVAEACDYIGGVTACFDMTARELQKTDGQWTRAKGFDTFLPLASLVAPWSPAWNLGILEVWKNNELVQKDCFSSMVFGLAELIADLSACMTLEPGDLILTGTPEGVGPVTSGDRLRITISGPAVISLDVNCIA
ncbi:MAG: fumarylacetoacetate hydrolase family protein [Candidatus Riflebacteria bacterium]|nr:fumarylacetoacetate hydrolase family protein [Candidatus Riflebacteria bacterium]